MDEKQLLENVNTVYKKISHAAMRAGRSPDGIRLIAVTKTVSADSVKTAVEIGLREFGENRVQEAQKKISDPGLQLKNRSVLWHLVGHLQKNKARVAVNLFDLIQSIDSVALAEEVDRHAEKSGKRQRILLQVKLSYEESKYGILKKNIKDMLARISGYQNLQVEGLMTIPPFNDDTEKVRPFFAELRELRNSLELSGYSLPELSMGMSHDYEVAIEEGATMVRVGTALFGERNT